MSGLREGFPPADRTEDDDKLGFRFDARSKGTAAGAVNSPSHSFVRNIPISSERHGLGYQELSFYRRFFPPKFPYMG